MRGQLISVTEEDIEQGIKWDCRKCPIALAIRRQVPGWEKATTYGLMVSNNEIHYPRKIVKLPRSARRFIDRFDKSSPVSSFKFYFKV